MKYYPVLQNCPLFAGIAESELKTLLDCLSSKYKRFRKNSFIFMADDAIDSLGVVLTGAVHIVREDYWGRRKIVARIESGGLFGEAFACAGIEKLPVSVTAAEETDVLFINCRRIIRSCSSACIFHIGLIKNVLLTLADKNVSLIQKLEYVTQPTTREKLLSFLSEQARLAGGNSFAIPFNREELADYLSVERSAMSAELSKMRDDGLIDYHKNNFMLKD